MDRSIYTALNSMNILRDNKSVTAQNLANVNVTGFQKDIQINFESAGTKWLVLSFAKLEVIK